MRVKLKHTEENLRHLKQLIVRNYTEQVSGEMVDIIESLESEISSLKSSTIDNEEKPKIPDPRRCSHDPIEDLSDRLRYGI